MIGTAGAELTNSQGQQLSQFCEALSLRAINTFQPNELEAREIYSGPTQWNPVGIHRIDYWLASATFEPIGLRGDRKLMAHLALYGIGVAFR